MKHLDLFSGIGGFALAARNVGWETVGFCEIEPYCQKVLAKHWPGVPIYDDIRQVTAERLRADGVVRAKTRSAAELDAMADTASADAGCREGFAESQKPVNGQSTQFLSDAGRRSGTTEAGRDSRLVITGGFPCQDISYAGRGAGIEGERSGLWTELARIIGEVRPRYAVLENVAALLSRGLDRVAGDLAEIGYDCEWHCIPASAVGAPHRRDRIWIVAYPGSTGTGIQSGDPEACGQARKYTDASQSEVVRPRNGAPDAEGPKPSRQDVADTQRIGRRQVESPIPERAPREEVAGKAEYSGSAKGQQGQSTQPRMGLLVDGLSARLAGPGWLPEPGIGRVASGVPDRVNKLRGLGNAIVPQVAQVIFEAINEVR